MQGRWAGLGVHCEYLYVFRSSSGRAFEQSLRANRRLKTCSHADLPSVAGLQQHLQLAVGGQAW